MWQPITILTRHMIVTRQWKGNHTRRWLPTKTQAAGEEIAPGSAARTGLMIVNLLLSSLRSLLAEAVIKDS